MFGLGKTLTFIINVFLGWLKSDLGVVLLYFGFDWQISVKKRKMPIFGKFDSLRLGVGVLA